MALPKTLLKSYLSDRKQCEHKTVENFGSTTDEIQSSIISELQEISKWLDVNKLCLNVKNSKFMLIHMPQTGLAKYRHL